MEEIELATGTDVRVDKVQANIQNQTASNYNNSRGILHPISGEPLKRLAQVLGANAAD